MPKRNGETGIEDTPAVALFKDSFFVPEKNWQRKAVLLPISILLYAAVIALLLILPCLSVNNIPKVEIVGTFLAPPPPPPPPKKEPSESARFPRRFSPTRFGPGKLVAPFEIPSEIFEEPPGGTGVGGGGEGGGRGGVIGGVVGGVIGGVLDKIAKEMEQPLLVSEFKQPKLIKRIIPVYPEVARQARVEGVVVVAATTDKFGRVIEAKIVKSIPLLDEATLDAVRQWIYEPMIIYGRPRGVIFTVTAIFKLEKSAVGTALEPTKRGLTTFPFP